MSKPTRIALVGATGLIGMTLIRMAVHRPLPVGRYLDAQLIFAAGTSLKALMPQDHELLHPMRCKGWSFTGSMSSPV